MTRTLPIVTLKADMEAIAKVCPFCSVKALVPLTKKQLAKQTDGTNCVCHPSIGGCNWGFNDSDMETEPNYPPAIQARFSMSQTVHDERVR